MCLHDKVGTGDFNGSGLVSIIFFIYAGLRRRWRDKFFQMIYVVYFSRRRSYTSFLYYVASFDSKLSHELFFHAVSDKSFDMKSKKYFVLNKQQLK